MESITGSLCLEQFCTVKCDRSESFCKASYPLIVIVIVYAWKTGMNGDGGQSI
jgi:hypothetical protein